MNCKAGELAFIINEPDFPENVGKVVQVGRVTFMSDDGIYWNVFSDSPVWVYANFTSRVKVLSQDFWILDSHLKPIRGPELKELEHEKELEVS